MDTKKIQIARGVREMLLQPLIDYLLGLAVAAPYVGNCSQTFLLSPSQLGGREVQTVCHCAQGEPSEYRMLFGFPPVHCLLFWDGTTLTLTPEGGSGRCA